MAGESISVTRSVAIPLEEIELRASRSSGPGGQHAQKSETRVEAVFDVEATVLGKPSPAYFAAAVEALDAEPAMTWMVGDDIESDIAGAQRFGLQTILVRTGKFRPDTVERGSVMPEAIVSSVAQLPAWLEQNA